MIFQRINGLHGLYVACITKRYDYSNGPVCPVCGAVAWIWGGWVTCDAGGPQKHIALTGSGKVFIKYDGGMP